MSNTQKYSLLQAWVLQTDALSNNTVCLLLLLPTYAQLITQECIYIYIYIYHNSV